MAMNNGSAFFTYCPENQTIIDQILKDLYPAKVEIIKDQRDTDNRNKMIRQMRVEKDSPIFLFLSDQFLRSETSMSDLINFIQDNQISDRIHPVLMAEVKNPDGSFTHTSFSQEGDLIRYKAYWDEIYWTLRKQKEHIPSGDLGAYSWRVREVRNIASEIESIFQEIQKYDLITLYQFKQDNYKFLFKQMGSNGNLGKELMDIHFADQFPKEDVKEEKVEEPVNEGERAEKPSPENAYINYLTEVQEELKLAQENQPEEPELLEEETVEPLVNNYPEPEEVEHPIHFEVSDDEQEEPVAISEEEEEPQENGPQLDEPEINLPEGFNEQDDTHELIDDIAKDMVEQFNKPIEEETSEESELESSELHDVLDEMEEAFEDESEDPDEDLDDLDAADLFAEEESPLLNIIEATQLPEEQTSPEEDDDEDEAPGDDDEEETEDHALLPIHESAAAAIGKKKSPFGKGLVLITGATAGIGEACADLYARNGFSLIITGRRKKRLKQLKKYLKKKYKVRVKSLRFDIRKPEAVEAAMDTLPKKWLAIDILVNNAGLAKGLAPIHEGDLDHWETMIDTNVKGLLYITRLVSPLMVERQKGHIVNIGSVAGKEVYPNGNVYCATKHAVDALTKAMRIDLYQHNIKVSVVHPGHVETEFALVRFDGDAKRADIYTDFQPLKAEDVADTVYYISTRPPHVNIQDVLMFSTQQGGATYVNRNGRDA